MGFTELTTSDKTKIIRVLVQEINRLEKECSSQNEINEYARIIELLEKS